MTLVKRFSGIGLILSFVLSMVQPAHAAFTYTGHYMSLEVIGVSAAPSGALHMWFTPGSGAPSDGNCVGNVVYFHRDQNNVAHSDAVRERMLSVAMAAHLSGQYVRVQLVSDSSGKCYAATMRIEKQSRAICSPNTGCGE